MAVRYDIILDNNLIYPISYVCFGSMNSMRDGNTPYGYSSSLLNNRDHSHYGRSDFQVEKIEYVRFYFLESASQETVNSYLAELRLLMSHMPCLDDIIFVDEANRHGYVRVKNQPADKVMFTLFVMRNLDYFARNRKRGYFLLRDTQDMHPLRALVLSDFFSFSQNMDFNTRTEVISVGEYPSISSESNLFNFATFGRDSFNRFLNQDRDYNPWFQQSFAENGNGYWREEHFGEESIRFPSLVPAPGVASSRNVSRTWHSGNTNRNRKLSDAHSLETDVTSLAPNLFNRSETFGFYMESSFGSMGLANQQARFEALVQAFNN